MDPSLQQAVKGGIAPLQEYLLQGSIVDSSKDVLIHRLRGLCDNAESQPDTFHDHEMVFQLRGNTPAQQPVSVHLRHSLIQTEAWHLRYVGSAELGDKNRQTLVRTCLDIGVSDTIVKFLNEMGFKLEYEFVAKGYFYHKGRMKVTVSKLFKVKHITPNGTDEAVIVILVPEATRELERENLSDMSQPGVTESLEPISLSYLVELSVVAPSGQEQIGEDMKNFAEQLRPLVQLEKVDHRRLQQATS